MSRASIPTLYLRLRKRMRVRKGESVLLGDIAQLIVDPEYENELKRVLLFRPEQHDGNLVLIDMMMIVRKVKALYPELEIEHYGEPHILVEVYDSPKPPKLLLITMVCVLLFIGSGLAIMNFHADVSMAEVHRRIYRLLTGKEAEHPLLLQIPYSIGIGIGMIVFFNHLFKKKFNEEPSPLEVEMFMYQENVNHYVITEEYGKIHEKAEQESKGAK
ncbi:stage V sporulation protein AA [Paenibacillus allorhizosphaerae]|uniref:Stage V sporulation protein AA domain-containing protein n=1 Tax=Paenibacillus allorhizosphaerae TaxID=2849866 RepID=A0ABN7TJZ9_9BACL|nr:stage V sporulation protein AA [Paenibacillus allorhizosphaerae]CAG7641774.1 hypothetical protein PAECIP111802_02777 [Paenibacillus allorhizosphaerae]